MLTIKDVNARYELLLEKKKNLQAVSHVIQDASKDLNIEISTGNVKLMEDLIEQTGQFKVLKADYVATFESFEKQLKDSGFTDDAIYYMTEMLKFENLKHDQR